METSSRGQGPVPFRSSVLFSQMLNNQTAYNISPYSKCTDLGLYKNLNLIVKIAMRSFILKIKPGESSPEQHEGKVTFQQKEDKLGNGRVPWSPLLSHIAV